MSVYHANQSRLQAAQSMLMYNASEQLQKKIWKISCHDSHSSFNMQNMVISCCCFVEDAYEIV